MASSKKPQKPQKPDDPPTEQPIGYAAEDIPEGGTGVMQPDPVRPMGIPDTTLSDRLEALELRLKVTEAWTNRHQRYHFGKEVSKG